MVLLEHVNSKFAATEVLAAEAVFFLMFDGQPVNIRTRHTVVDYPGPKYKRVAYVNHAHCFNVAGRLNRLFKCDRFTVGVSTGWRSVVEDERGKPVPHDA